MNLQDKISDWGTKNLGEPSLVWVRGLCMCVSFSVANNRIQSCIWHSESRVGEGQEELDTSHVHVISCAWSDCYSTQNALRRLQKYRILCETQVLEDRFLFRLISECSHKALCFQAALILPGSSLVYNSPSPSVVKEPHNPLYFRRGFEALILPAQNPSAASLYSFFFRFW